MKRKTFQTKKVNIKVLIALVILGIAGVGAIVATQARRNILKGTQPFAEKSEFKILEIVPTNANDANEELGYFVSDEGGKATDAGKADFKDVSLAKSLGGRSEMDVNTPLYQEELQNFMKLREYGLVKFEGIDRGIYNVDVSEHPVYSAKANFVKKATQGYRLLENQYVLGSYVKTEVANGSYYLKEGYTISGNGLICKEVQREVTVSDNSVSGNTTYKTEWVTDYEPILAADPDNKQLPEAVEQRFDEDGELLMNGNLNFVADENGVYYGFTNDAYYVYERPDAENNAFHNGDWFKEYVLGERASDQKVVVTTIAANEVTVGMLGDIDKEEYDLIYISGTYEAYQALNVDLSKDVVMALYNMATMPQYQAIMMDHKLLGGDSSSNPSYIEILALMLWQKDQRAILSMETEGLNSTDIFEVDDKDKVVNIPEPGSTTWSILGSSMNETPGMSTGNFVAGSVYVYDHKREYFMDSKVRIDAADFFANGDFASEYTSAVVGTGLTAVKIAVQMNNINHVDKKVPEVVTPATIIQYILAYDGTNPSLVKTDLRILEIQPVRAFRYNSYWGTTVYTDCVELIQNNRMDFIKKFLDDRFEKNPELVSFTSMTIEEFIGRNADINEEYDLIYIGSETSHQLLNTSSGKPSHSKKTYYYMKDGYSTTYAKDSKGNIQMNTGVTTKVSVFNDEDMCGMVYYNIGDEFWLGTKKSSNNSELDSLLGIVGDGSVYGNTKANTAKGKSRGRFSGRDFTEDKLKQMKEFLDAGYPVIVAGDIVRCVPTSTTTEGLIKKINPTEYFGQGDKAHKIDHGRVDNCSKLYEFLEYAVYNSKNNLISEGDVEFGLVKKKDISEYLNKPKLSVNLTSRPVEYSYSTKNVASGGLKGEAIIDTPTSLAKDPTTGKYNLDYEFTITNVGTIATGEGTYNVHLYVDVNADGKFSEQEELKDCTITNAVTGVEVPSDVALGGKKYSLQSDVLYKLHREVPQDYSGILPWNLEVVMESDSLVRASEQGYTLVPRATAEKISIDILQVNNSKTTLNLQEKMLDSNYASNYFGLYLRNLQDYNVKVTTVSQEDFQNYAYKDMNEKYNMLILGFGDCYEKFENSEAISAIVDFIESGKPVLLTHDLVMFRAGAIQTKMLRNHVGMDRYGCYDESDQVKVDGKFVLNDFKRVINNKEVYITQYTRSADLDVVNAIEGAGHRVAYVPGSKKETIDTTTHGVTNLTMVRYRNNYGLYKGNEGDEYRYIADHKGINELESANWKDQCEYMVHNINEGQITTYPYILPDKFNVAQTHNQYYQLDMEGDMDEDGETDIVVWYTLGNRYMNGKELDGGYVDDGSEYNFTPNDVVNGYYIYNKGNVTYSGVGHSEPGKSASQKYEAQLFVNTMIAAYRAGVRAPKVTFYDSEKADANTIVSLPVVYDKNVGLNAELGNAESSVLKFEDGTFKNEFVNEGNQATKLYFDVIDENLVRGTKGIELQFYVEDPEGSETLNVTDSNGNKQTVKARKIVRNVYLANGTTTSEVKSSEDGPVFEPTTRYAVDLPLSGLKDKGEVKFYVSAKTTIYNKTVSNKTVTQNSDPSVVEFSIIKMDLLNLD